VLAVIPRAVWILAANTLPGLKQTKPKTTEQFHLSIIENHPGFQLVVKGFNLLSDISPH